MRRCTFHPRRLTFWRQMQGLVLTEAQQHPNIFVFKLMFRTSVQDSTLLNPQVEIIRQQKR